MKRIILLLLIVVSSFAYGQTKRRVLTIPLTAQSPSKYDTIQAYDVPFPVLRSNHVNSFLGNTTFAGTNYDFSIGTDASAFNDLSLKADGTLLLRGSTAVNINSNNDVNITSGNITLTASPSIVLNASSTSIGYNADIGSGLALNYLTGGGTQMLVVDNVGAVTAQAIPSAGAPTTRNINTTSPLSGGGDLSADRTIAISNSAADGSTKGAASFTAADFNSSSGNISIDYTNGQASSGSTKGFLSPTDWTTFNGKQSTLISGTNIKTINGNSLLGSGDLSVAGGVASVTITQPATGIAITNSGSIQTGAVSSTVSLANDLAAIEGLGSTGLATRTGTDTWSQRTVTGTTDQITVTNGNGVSGNPTLSLPSTLVLPNGTTGTTQVALSNDTKVATDEYVNKAVGQFPLKGQVINETFASSFANYTATGTATWSLPGGGVLQGAGGSSFDLASYVSHSAWGNTAIRNFSQSIEVIVGTLSSTSQGVQLSAFGKGAGGQNSVNFVLRLNTARQGFLESYINNTSALVGGVDFFLGSTNAITVAAGDRVKLTLDVVENEYIFRAVNLTQPTTQPVTLIRTTSPVTGTQWANYSTIQFGFGVVGGTHQFDNHIVSINEPIAPPILVAGNSIATGAGGINVEQSFPKQFEGLTGLKVMRWSGGGNVARDLRGADIIKYADPTKTIVILEVGINDIITGRTSGQVITDINQVITDLGAGWTLGTNLFILEVLPYTTFSSQVQTYNTAYQTNYAAGLIRLYQSFNNGSGGMQTSLVNADLLHPNWMGHKLMADYIYQDLRDRGVISASAKAKSNQSQVYTYNGFLGLSAATPFTPTYALQSISNKQQLIVGNDATNPTFGGGMISTSATHLSIRSGMVFDGSNNISTGSAGQSEFVLQDGALSWRSNSGIAAGSSVGTMNTYFRGLSTGLFGIGPANTNPLSQLHITNDAATAQGILLEVHAATQTENTLLLRKSRGNLLTAAAILDTDYGSLVKFDHYSGSSYLRTVSMGTRINGTVTTTSVPTDFFIATSATGTTDPYTNGTVKFLVSSAGNVGISTISPTARLHLPAGTTASSSSPLKLTLGSDMTTAETGVFEYSPISTINRLAFTPTGTTRKRIPLSNDVAPTNGQVLIGNGTDFTVSSLTAGTNVTLTPGSGTLTIASAGITNSGSTNELVKSDGTNVVGTGFFSSSSGTMSTTGQMSFQTSGSNSVTFDTRGSSTGGGFSVLTSGSSAFGRTNSSTNTVNEAVRVNFTSSGTPATGTGTSLTFETATATSNPEIGSTIESVSTDVTSTSEDFDLVFKTMAAGATAAERMRISSTGTVIGSAAFRLKSYTVATLPTGVTGDTALVTDALAPSYLVTAVGGGTVVTPVFYNGSSWVAH